MGRMIVVKRGRCVMIHERVEVESVLADGIPNTNLNFGATCNHARMCKNHYCKWYFNSEIIDPDNAQDFIEDD